MMPMVPAGPLRMVTSPDRVNTCRSAAPVTLRLFSKRPCSEADATVVASKRPRATADNFANPFRMVRSFHELIQRATGRPTNVHLVHSKRSQHLTENLDHIRM